MICPIVNFLAGLADKAYTFLAESFLSVSPEMLKMDSSNATFVAWQRFLLFGNILFVIAFIAIIYSQLTSVGISNYGVKKMLPRLIIGAVLINLSFIICQAAVDISNILGYALKSLLANAAGTGTALDVGVSATGDGWQGIAGTVLVAGGAAAVGVGAAGGITLALVALLGMLLSAVVSLIMIFFILVLREVLIVLLIVLAPLAFAAYLLPNTEQWFKKWQKTFTSLLLVFPVIGIVYGASSLASSVVTDLYSNTDDMLGQIVGAGILVLPLFVVPGLLKKSIDAVGSLGGKLSGAGGKLGGKLSGGVKGSKFAKHQQGLADIRRAQKSAGTYKGRGGRLNPSNWRSGINKRLNNADWYNRATGDYGKKLAARGAGIEDDLFEKEVKEAALTQIGMTHDEKLDMARGYKLNADGTKGDAVKATKEQRTAAMDSVMATGGFTQRRQMLEAVAAGSDQNAKARAVKAAYAKGDQNIYGVGFGDQILGGKIGEGTYVDGNGVTQQRKSLAEAAVENAADGGLQAEHLVQSGSATEWLQNSIATSGNGAASRNFQTAANQARQSEGTAAKIDGKMEAAFTASGSHPNPPSSQPSATPSSSSTPSAPHHSYNPNTQRNPEGASTFREGEETTDSGLIIPRGRG